MIMTDTDMINWIETKRAQIWFETRPGGGWTVQVRPETGGFIQPTRNSLRDAIEDAAKQMGQKQHG